MPFIRLFWPDQLPQRRKLRPSPAHSLTVVHEIHILSTFERGKDMKARISRKFFCLLLAVVMVCTLLPTAALAAGPSGSIERAVITHDNGVLKNAVSVDLKNVNFESSVQVQLYSGKTLLTTATLNTDKLEAGSYPYLTCCIATQTADEYWSLTSWTPKDDVVPNKAVLVVDGRKLDEETFTLDADEWAALPGTMRPSSGSIPPINITPPDDDDEPDQPADPDDTGVSDLLNTKDHDQYLFGYPDGTFGPGLNMTRAEAAQMFYNLLVDQKVTAKPVFDDVPEGAWYAEPVNVMAKLGIVEGVGDDKFEPDREITRAEFTAMAMRFAEGETGGKNIFSDVDEDDWFYEVVVDSIKYGWIEGYPDGTFRPANLITREEVTTIVNRMLGRLPDEDYIDAHEDDLDLFPDVTKNWAYYDVVEATNDHQYKKTSSGEDWTKLG